MDAVVFGRNRCDASPMLQIYKVSTSRCLAEAFLAISQKKRKQAMVTAMTYYRLKITSVYLIMELQPPALSYRLDVLHVGSCLGLGFGWTSF